VNADVLRFRHVFSVNKQKICTEIFRGITLSTLISISEHYFNISVQQPCDELIIYDLDT